MLYGQFDRESDSNPFSRANSGADWGDHGQPDFTDAEVEAMTGWLIKLDEEELANLFAIQFPFLRPQIQWLIDETAGGLEALPTYVQAAHAVYSEDIDAS